MGSPLPAAHHAGWSPGGGPAETEGFFPARAERIQVEPGPGPRFTADEDGSAGFAASLKFLLAVMLVAGLLIGGCSSDDESPDGEAVADSEESSQPLGGAWPVAEVAAKVEPSVVQVNVEVIETTPFGSEAREGLGSGVIYREDGYIITNNHVVEGASEVNVAFADGSVEEGEVVGGDPSTDVAVVRVDRDGLPAADFAENPNLRLGQLAVAVGSPSGFQSTVTSGVVSGLGREIPVELTGGLQQDPALVDLIQTDAPISPGNSGGALANPGGEVVGINVASLPPGQTGAVGIGFAIPSPTAVSVADQLIEHGEADHPYLGVSLTTLTPQTAERFGTAVEAGALVVDVDPNGPAAAAGIEAGSVITGIDDQTIEDVGDLLAALRGQGPGDEVEITAATEGEAREVSVELGQRP